MRIIKRTIYSLIAPLLRRVLRDSITSKHINGIEARLYYDRSQHLGFLFAKQISYEGEFSGDILKHIKEGDLVFEIGSNIGQYALQISKKIGDSGKLICLEPDSDNFAFLCLNVYKNNLLNVELLKCAVSNKEEVRNFYKDSLTGGRMSSLIKEFSGSQYQGRSEKVQTVTLTKLIQRYGTPSFVKIDVEGAEDLIFEDEKAIHVETTYLIEVRDETKEFVFNRFQLLGFSIFLLESNMKRILSANEIPGFGNLLIKH